MRPRTAAHRPTSRLARERAPELHALIDDVAGALGTAAPEMVIVDDEYNAYWMVAGLRRRRVLAVGMPLFDPLDAQERVALIAHELGHARNGDAGRGLIVGSVVQALAALYELVAPGSRLLARTWEVSLAEPLANAFMWVVSRSVRSSLPTRSPPALRARPALWICTRRRCSPRRSGGATHRALHHDGAEPFDLFGEMRRAVATLHEHEHERERRRRIARREAARLDVTHPPMGQRIALLESRQRVLPPFATPDSGAHHAAEEAVEPGEVG